MAAPVEENEVGAHGSWAERESDRAFASRLAEGEPLLKVNLLYDPVGEKLPKHISHLKANDPVKDASELSPDFQFAAAVAGYGLLLRESPYRGDVNTGMVRRLAEAGLAYDPHGLRREFTELVGASSAVLP